MTTITDKPVAVEQVACEICLKEVPKSEATVPEGAEYVLYFCGLDCFEKWKAQQDTSAAGQSATSSAS